ncbi:class IIb bacteriocin, lactobin A/cerein 7B family [Paenibacillus hexagrammi]|uniref:Class IIb bacteriocin, lactobin A/cerein 7B family n=1 Tax=Paenibacillus hexagrammi TaxID=2908839 RepID=A0ABY3SMP4_9BACL|nr:class IIb bacteriocin, lactobin A/cerein 7B family [Paenibacillus sp. YPD9-1]UJF34227.1 class IIb bacteriocin, lactobin A/cerein 7B family [Paenibacillus sp. YPD9-1]
MVTTIGMREMNEQELFETNGGWIIIAAAVLFVGSALAVGIYNGYKDAEAAAAKK